LCRVLINLLDENDNYPIIDIYSDEIERNSNKIKIYLNESLEINSLILSLTIIDRDSGDNGRITWKMDRLSFIPFELIRLTENTGELRTNQLLDRELISEYNLTIEANDHGRPLSKSTQLNIHIIILDINDNKPKFQENNITVTINEHVKFNNSYGYEVYHVHANDIDEGINGEIIYLLINNEKNIFSINSNTGIIYALKEFDRKQQDIYILKIQAKDKGIPSLLSEEIIINFKIINQNQYKPKCDIKNKNISWSIMENSQLGTIIGSISCSDDDNDEFNGQISVDYKWILGDKIPFEIIIQKSNTSQVIILICFCFFLLSSFLVNNIHYDIS
jgi:HD superfamily phosphohydrolase